ncbi:DNA-directed RNA polymerases II, IV and V subunit 3-like [Pyrus ussuriensis x Pyrus communis]|uniref:DNA-directed RNA polymerases II, IV and V subunit 3-like n=1 Tax=Pyrus ussuriensis x Pyrus communis TaxID=2448454 RepID=A0A5N5FC76_9ROSA|nr:DNA-directed RNA polymerases II, IV and V subunit 3-like [Pyrus ussuriensis x Pyrus communis]
MAPKVARIQSHCETGEGISTMRRLLNGLHRPRVGLHTELFFEEGEVHSLGPAWISQISVAIENNMPKEKSASIVFSETFSSSRAALIALVDSTYRYQAIFSCTDIHKLGLPHSFCFLDHFIIIGVCFGINYHDFVGFRINIKDFGKTCGKRPCYGGNDHRGVF